jgi:hypothetical protein
MEVLKSTPPPHGHTAARAAGGECAFPAVSRSCACTRGHALAQPLHALARLRPDCCAAVRCVRSRKPVRCRFRRYSAKPRYSYTPTAP